jgi:glycosyltransferase involved in cell wall biosynthesis/SAM-dependent methyltransferase
MRIAIANTQVPYIKGGAELLAEGLKNACEKCGYQVEVIDTPFRFHPTHEVKRIADFWEQEDFKIINDYLIDKVITLKFPTYYLQHEDKILWLIHQHRTIYDLWDSNNDNDNAQLRNYIIEKDNYYLGAIKNRFTISKTVANRLYQFNNLNAEVIYHPPLIADKLYSGEQLSYIFFPSRIEHLKRQDLLIRAMQYVKSPVAALIAGSGGQYEQMLKLVAQLGLESRVRLLGAISQQELLSYYANALGIFFGPYQEDYGYVTLEAMISEKAVITCQDSGGPLEFIEDGENGYIVAPEPENIAEAIEKMYNNKKVTYQMGILGKEKYKLLNISWTNVLKKLLERDVRQLDKEQKNERISYNLSKSDINQDYTYQPSITVKDYHQAVAILKAKYDGRIQECGIDNASPSVVDEIINISKDFNIEFECYTIDVNDYHSWFQQAGYATTYCDYYSSNQYEKSLEHYAAYNLLKLKKNDIFVDLASEHSPVSGIYQKFSHAKTYTQDIMYPPGLIGNQIGSDACSMPVPDNFFDKALLSCSLEHFEGDSDTLLFHEISRVLKPGGILCVLPFYIYIKPAVQTDPTFAVATDVKFDNDATIYCSKGWGNRHGRFYSPLSFTQRILNPVKNELQFYFYYFDNAKFINDSIYLRFAFTAIKK